MSEFYVKPGDSVSFAKTVGRPTSICSPASPGILRSITSTSSTWPSRSTAGASPTARC